MHEMCDHSQQDGDTGQGQDYVRLGDGNFASPDQRRDGGHAQEQRKVQKPAPVMVEMMVTTVSVPAMSVPVTAPAALFGLAFFERKFVAHADIKFTHVIPYVSYGPFGRTESIIMESSNIKYNHQIIIISI